MAVAAGVILAAVLLSTPSHNNAAPGPLLLTGRAPVRLTPYAGGKRAYADMVISAPGAVGTSRYRHLVP